MKTANATVTVTNQYGVHFNMAFVDGTKAARKRLALVLKTAPRYFGTTAVLVTSAGKRETQILGHDGWINVA